MSALLDTNIVVRYLTGDPPHLAQGAISIIDSGEPLVLSDVALAEAGYVLGSFYGIPRESIVDSLMGFVQKETISVLGREKGLILQALLLCRPSHRVSFADALIWAAARSEGIEVVYSQDTHFPRDGIQVRARLR